MTNLTCTGRHRLENRPGQQLADEQADILAEIAIRVQRARLRGYVPRHSIRRCDPSGCPCKAER